MNNPPVFEPLGAQHDWQSFGCGKAALNSLLQRQARQNADRNVRVTHVAVAAAGESRIRAYYALLTWVVDAEIMPNKKPPRGEIGVALLGRLAVDQSAQGQGLGRLCLLRAMTQVERAAREIGLYALVLDALDEEARTWHLRLPFGSQPLLDDPRHLYLLVETIRQSFSSSL